MEDNSSEIKKPNKYMQAYNKSTSIIIIFACFIIVLSVIFTGVINYRSSERAIIKKSQTVDMINVLNAISSKLEGVIARAEETSVLLSTEPVINSWVNSGETNKVYGEMSLKRLFEVATSYGYSNAFIVSKGDGHYYWDTSNDRKLTDQYTVLKNKDPKDAWFFNTLKSKQRINLNVDYDRVMNDTFLFVNVLMGKINKPTGITGVGMSLKDISLEFSKIKAGDKSDLWLVDDKNKIQLSEELNQRGKDLSSLLPLNVLNQITNGFRNNSKSINITEYVKHGDTIDLAFSRLPSTNWILVYRIPRAENMKLIGSIKANTVSTAVIVIIFVVFLFSLISIKISNPYRNTVLLNQELEEKVKLRTNELVEANTLVMDSIDYAKRMQEAILPTTMELDNAFIEHFIIWRPRDIVGGDFYWLRNFKTSKVIVVGDCTGHGVPGALMTMAVSAMLNNIVTLVNNQEPVEILRELDKQIKQVFNKNDESDNIDDGLDIGICCIINDSQIKFAGAKLDLYITHNGGVNTIKGFKREVGYRKGNFDEYAGSGLININRSDTLYIATDGLLHQNGGEKNYPFGIKNLENAMLSNEGFPLAIAKNEFLDELHRYMQNEQQRDDITLLGFRIK